MLTNENKAGIYIHIPFCKLACNYCNFHFSTSFVQKEAFLNALSLELVARKNYLAGKSIQSIYFGGGTPSTISAEALLQIVDDIRSQYQVDRDAEITLEVNPDDISAEYLTAIKSAGFNRISIGIQSFYDRDLKWMNRSHSAAQAELSLDLIRDAGFQKITADLIYGIPMLTHDEWKLNIEKVLSKGVNHISCYALTVEPKTVLQHLIAKGKSLPLNDQHTAEQFEILQIQLKQAGFEHYEISNFAKNKQYARHNSAYWLGNHYLGLGPSAHSFNGISREWNVANNALYIKSTANNLPHREVEILSSYTQMNERIMTSLRTMWGLDLMRFEEDFGHKNAESVIQEMQPLVSRGLIHINNSTATITESGKIFADGIISDLFFTE